MTQTVATPLDSPAQTPISDEAAPSISTRFGDLTVDADKIITFDQGLYGLEHHRRFLLTEVPGWPDFFKLLQAVDDSRFSLIVLPLEVAEGPIDPGDFADACRTLGYNPAVTLVIGIVTMRDDGGSQVFTVNLKAPLLIDSDRRQGRQHVFASEKYHLRHPLQAPDQDAANQTAADQTASDQPVSEQIGG